MKNDHENSNSALETDKNGKKDIKLAAALRNNLRRRKATSTCDDSHAQNDKK